MLGKARYKYINVNIFHNIKFKLMMCRNGGSKGAPLVFFFFLQIEKIQKRFPSKDNNYFVSMKNTSKMFTRSLLLHISHS